MERKTVEFCVGLFVLLGFLALIFVSLQAANLGNFSWNAKTYELSANSVSYTHLTLPTTERV